MHPTTFNAKAYSAGSATSPLASTKINRRDQLNTTCRLKSSSGICRSDLHSVRNEGRSSCPRIIRLSQPQIVGHVTGSARQSPTSPGYCRSGLHGRFGRGAHSAKWP
jgi:hypothetical protein